MIKSNRHIYSIQEKVFCFALIFMIVGNTYSVGESSFTYGEIIMAVTIMWLLTSRKFSLSIKTEFMTYYIFLIYAIFISIFLAVQINGTNISDTLIRLARDGFYIIIFLVFGYTYFNKILAVKMLRILAVLLSTFIIIQFLMYLLSGIFISGLFPGLLAQGITSGQMNKNILGQAVIQGYVRPNGFLMEPSSCGQLLSLALAIELFNRSKSRYKVYRIVLYITAMLMTTSAVSIVMLICAFAFWIYDLLRQKKQIYYISFIVCIILFTIIMTFSYINIPFVSDTINRMFTISSRAESNPQWSEGLRIFRGMAFYCKLPFVNKLFGIGFGNFIAYKASTGITTPYEIDIEYMNMDAYVLNSAGLIGCIILGCTIILVMKHRGNTSRYLMIMFLIMGLAVSMYSSAIYVIYLCFILYNHSDTRICARKSVEVNNS